MVVNFVQQDSGIGSEGGGRRCQMITRIYVNYSSIMLFQKLNLFWGPWVAQSVKRPASAQVMISRLVGSSPASGSVLAGWSLEPASDSVSPSLSAPPPHMLCLSLSLKNK